jgi:hypothetical protein
VSGKKNTAISPSFQRFVQITLRLCRSILLRLQPSVQQDARRHDKPIAPAIKLLQGTLNVMI